MKSFYVATVSVSIFFLFTLASFAGKSPLPIPQSIPQPIKIVPCLVKHFSLQNYIGGLEFITDYKEKYFNGNEYEAGTYEGIGLNDSKSDYQTPDYVTFTKEFALKIEDGYFATDQTYNDAVDSYNKTEKFETVIKEHFGKKSIVNCEIKHFNGIGAGLNTGFIFSCQATLLCK